MLFAPDEELEYCPDRALSDALHDWMDELNQPLQPGTVVSVHLCI